MLDSLPIASLFPENHSDARRSFQRAVRRLGWNLESLPMEVLGPDGEPLAFDVGLSPERNEDDRDASDRSMPGSVRARADRGRVLVVSTGLHGVEGFFGSAVLAGLMERWAATHPPPVRCVLLHGLNPFGYSWLRRVDENNVDPNRNFLLPGEPFAGTAADYARLDPLLNPRRPPSRWEPFRLKAIWQVARYGIPALRQAVAAGQHDYPRGLFYAGAGPTRIQQLLDLHFPRWLSGSTQVVHLDFHTGLGRHGACKLLIDYPLTDRQRGQMERWFGPDSFERSHSDGIAYEARGGFGRWCVARQFANDYLFACAEFGTYDPISVLAGLRAENQAHHWGDPRSPSTARTKARLKELFCPSSPTWRTRVIERALGLVEQAAQGLVESPPN